MAESLLAYALSTVARIKDRITITASGGDAVLQRLLNGATDFIEGRCGRRFKETTYTNEVYSVRGAGRSTFLLLNQAPVSALTTLEYSVGLPNDKQWTAFAATDYELQGSGREGIVEIAGVMPGGTNKIRATYTAGYKINFANAGDMSTHTLPADISDLAERLVVKAWKKKEAEGKSSEAFDGGTINWKDLLDDSDQETIDRYSRNAVRLV